MRVLVAHLWKEWREHRAVLAAIAGAIPVLLAIGFSVSDDLAYGVHWAFPWVVAAGTALTVLALATEAWPSESKASGLALLRRTPRALGAAVAGKTVFYLVASVATAAWTTGVVFLLAGWLVGDVTRRETWLSVRGSAMPWAPAAGTIVVGLWGILASTWVPRGAAAIGLGGLLLVALLGPAALALRAYDWGPVGQVVPVAAALVVVAPLLATAFGTLRGLGRGRGHRGAFARGGVVLLALAVPSYAWGAVRLERWVALDPSDPEFRMVSAALSEDGRYAYVTVGRAPEFGSWTHRNFRPWKVDLATGAWTAIGALGERVEADRSTHANGLGWIARTGLVAVHAAERPDGAYAWWDADAGTPWRTLPHDFRPPDLLERLRPTLRARSTGLGPAGVRAWTLDGRIEWDGSEGLESGAVPGVEPTVNRRVGWWGSQATGGEPRYVLVGFDAGGRLAAVPHDGERGGRVRVRLSVDSMVEGPNPYRPKQATGDWLLFRAGSEPVRLSSLEASDHVVALAPDLVLASRRRSDGGGVEARVVDVARDEARPCRFPASIDGRVRGWIDARSWSPSGNVLLTLSVDDLGVGYALLSPSTGKIHGWFPARGGWGVGFFDDDTVFHLEERGLVRLDFDTNTRTKVFPRE